jgi:threonine dehydratase
MPKTAPKAKVEAVRRYGGNINLCDPTLEARENAANRLRMETGAALIHPYNDLRVMAGQGTTGVELLEDVPNLDFILCPVGGGGHLSGIAVAAKSMYPAVHVIGVEPNGADDARRSFEAGRVIPSVNPKSIADGLLTSLGEKPFAEIQQYVDDIVSVSDDAIIDAMRLIWEVMKIVVEPSGAVGYAALAAEKLDVKGKRVGVILTGGNLDLDCLPWRKM